MMTKGEKISAQKIRHGEAIKGHKTSEYLAWRNMKTRCYNKANVMWPRYGKRGITVCAAWLNSFEAFLSDLGRKPGKTYSLDRIDTDGNYEPQNCRWATRKEQARNKSNNTFLTHAGKSMPIAAWAEETGISEDVLHLRVRRLKWDHGRAVTTPVGKCVRRGSRTPASCKATMRGPAHDPR